MRKLTKMLLLAIFAANAAAHDYWLEPAPKRKGSKTVAITLQLGTDFGAGEEKPLQVRRLSRLERIGAESTRDLRPEVVDGRKPALELPASETQDGALIAMDRNAARIILDNVKFNAYLQSEGLESVLRERARTNETKRAGREEYTRFLKLLLPGSASGDLATRKIGQTLEIVPESDPTRLRAGKKLAALVSFEGAPLPNASVLLSRRTRGKKVESERANTDAGGRAEFTVRGAGLHVLRLVHMRRAQIVSDDFHQPEWQSYWTSYVFAIRSR